MCCCCCVLTNVFVCIAHAQIVLASMERQLSSWLAAAVAVAAAAAAGTTPSSFFGRSSV